MAENNDSLHPQLKAPSTPSQGTDPPAKRPRGRPRKHPLPASALGAPHNQDIRTFLKSAGSQIPPLQQPAKKAKIKCDASVTATLAEPKPAAVADSVHSQRPTLSPRFIRLHNRSLLAAPEKTFGFFQPGRKQNDGVREHTQKTRTTCFDFGVVEKKNEKKDQVRRHHKIEDKIEDRAEEKEEEVAVDFEADEQVDEDDGFGETPLYRPPRNGGVALSGAPKWFHEFPSVEDCARVFEPVAESEAEAALEARRNDAPEIEVENENAAGSGAVIRACCSVTLQDGTIALSYGGAVWGLDGDKQWLVVAGYAHADDRITLHGPPFKSGRDAHVDIWRQEGPCAKLWRTVRVPGAAGAVRHLRIMPNIYRLNTILIAAATGDGRVLVWPMRFDPQQGNDTWQLLQSLNPTLETGPQYTFTRVAWDRESGYLAAGTTGGKIVIFERACVAGAPLVEVRAHGSYICDLEFLSKTRVVSCSGDGRLVISDIQDTSNVCELFRTRGPIYSCAAVDSRILYSDVDNKVRRVFESSRKYVKLGFQHHGAIWSVRIFRRRGTRGTDDYSFLTASADGQSCVSEIEVKRSAKKSKSMCMRMTFGPDVRDGSRIVARKVRVFSGNLDQQAINCAAKVDADVAQKLDWRQALHVAVPIVVGSGSSTERLQAIATGGAAGVVIIKRVEMDT